MQTAYSLIFVLAAELQCIVVSIFLKPTNEMFAVRNSIIFGLE